MTIIIIYNAGAKTVKLEDGAFDRKLSLGNRETEGDQ